MQMSIYCQEIALELCLPNVEISIAFAWRATGREQQHRICVLRLAGMGIFVGGTTFTKSLTQTWVGQQVA